MQYNIYDGGRIVFENEWYQQITNDNYIFKYSYNYFALKKVPTQAVFSQLIIDMAIRKVNAALTIRLPRNTLTLPADFEQWIKITDFSMSTTLLFLINTNDFIQKVNPTICVRRITVQNKDDWLMFCYSHHKQWGINYAENMNAAMTCELAGNTFTYYTAYQAEKIVGALTVITHSQNVIELDSFYVLPEYQHLGVGTTLQSVIMQQYPSRQLILAAAGDDTPQTMYRKQGYQQIAAWLELQRITK